MYAVVKTGGKQYKVAQDDVIRVEKIEQPVGETVELDQVALVAKDDGIVVEPSALANAKVICQVTQQDKRKKVIVHKRKRRKGYQRTHGHRQAFTELRVRQIVTE